MSTEPSAVAITAAIALLLCIAVSTLRPRSPSTPPGPHGLPIIGNLLDMPREHEWRTFAEWKHKWGDLVYLNVCGTPMIVLNSAQHASALLDRRSALYSDRPHMPVVSFVGYAQQLVMSPYNSLSRGVRRLFAQMLGSKQCMVQFIPLVERELHKTALLLWRDSNRDLVDPTLYTRRSAGAIALELAYGYTVQDKDDVFVQMVETTLDDFAKVTAPGAFLANTIPFLLQIPDWVPGFDWKRTLSQWQENLLRACNIPFERVKEQMADGTYKRSFSALHLENGASPEEEEMIKIAAMAIYGGGADTTTSALSSLFFAILVNPEVQSKAHAEIDRVVGRGRLPTHADRQSLPYIEAVFKEILRWNPVAPLGVPHCLDKDDVYEGYMIRKGTVLLPNIWQFLHDPQTYKDPLAFKPERFLKSDGGSEPELDPGAYVFGFGRRVCPGQFLADAALYMHCLINLALFSVSPTKGEFNIKPGDVQYTTGTISHPPAFSCRVEPRNEEAERLLEELATSMHSE